MKQEIQIGDIVAFNNLPDAEWFDVVDIKGPILILREHGTDYATQRMHKSLVKQVRTPTPRERVESIWRAVMEQPAFVGLAVSEKEWQFYEALLRAKP
jgi:hypothetical protein